MQSLLDGERSHSFKKKCDAGPPIVLHRRENKLWRSEENEATLLLRLIGAGRKQRRLRN